MMTEGLSTRAVARECNVYFTTILTASNVILENLALHPTSLTTTDHMYGVLWVSGLLISTL
jgi:hypothetical protein